MGADETAAAVAALVAPLKLIARDEPAATVAVCLVLKTGFLALHLLALHLPRCTGLERLALLHWTLDWWNVWALVQFTRTGRLPWSLETCVLYHVLGYMVFSLVYAHLQHRERKAAGSEGTTPFAMSTTPESDLTERFGLSGEDTEPEETEEAPSHPFGTPGRGGVLSEDVPDEDREDTAGREDIAGREGLRTITEDSSVSNSVSTSASASPPPPEPTKPEPKVIPVKVANISVRLSPASASSAPPLLPLQPPSPAAGGSSGRPSPGHPSPSSTSRPYRKLDAAGSSPPSPPPPVLADNRDITEHIAAALKAGRRLGGCEGDTDITGFNKYSPVKAMRAGSGARGSVSPGTGPAPKGSPGPRVGVSPSKEGTGSGTGQPGGGGDADADRPDKNGAGEDKTAANGDERRRGGVNGDKTAGTNTNGDHNGHGGANGTNETNGDLNGTNGVNGDHSRANGANGDHDDHSGANGDHNGDHKDDK